MTIGTSIFLIAVGAILKYAVTATVAGVDIETVGVILMVAGVVGLVIGLFLMISARERRGDVTERRVVREDRRDPL
jgi:beta-lactamase regulating signal transducer with metallopeptidase domain